MYMYVHVHHISMDKLTKKEKKRTESPPLSPFPFYICQQDQPNPTQPNPPQYLTSFSFKKNLTLKVFDIKT